MATEPAADAAALKDEINSREPLLLSAVEARQAELITALSPAQELKVVEVGRQVALLREMAQGGLGLGSGGKAKRGQELLELLRGVSLVTPGDGAVTPGDKEAAVKALQEQVDKKLQEQKVAGEKAAGEAGSKARAQTLIAALQSRIRFQPGGKPLTLAVAAAVLHVAGEEVGAAITPAGELKGGKEAAQQLLALVSLMDSAGAALAAQHGEEAEGETATLPWLCQEVCDTLEQLQEVVEGVIKATSTASSSSPGEGAAEEADGEAEAESAASGGDEKVREVLGKLEGQVKQLAAEGGAGKESGAAEATEQQGEGEGEATATAAAAAAGTDDAANNDGFEAQVRVLKAEVEDAAAAAKAAVQQRHEAGIADAGVKERLTIIMDKVKQITAGAAAGEGEQSDAAASVDPAERIVVVEAWLQQLGTRPLTAAVDGLQKLLGEALTTTTTGSDTGAQAVTVRLLGDGVTLEGDSQAQVTKMTQLLSEIELCESVMRLELGPNLRAALRQLSSYLEKDQSEAEQKGEGEEEEEGSGQEEGRMLSPLQQQEKEAAGKIQEVVRELGAEGLVLLQLTGPQYRQLAQFREAVAMLKPGGDAMMLDR
jgi:hypothetical protein